MMMMLVVIAIVFSYIFFSSLFSCLVVVLFLSNMQWKQYIRKEGKHYDCFLISVLLLWKGAGLRVVGDWGAVGARARLDLETGAAWIWKPPTYPSVRCIFHFWDMETTYPSIPCGYGNHLSISCGYWNHAPIHPYKESAAYNSALHLSTLEDGKHLRWISTALVTLGL